MRRLTNIDACATHTDQCCTHVRYKDDASLWSVVCALLATIGVAFLLLGPTNYNPSNDESITRVCVDNACSMPSVAQHMHPTRTPQRNAHQRPNARPARHVNMSCRW